MKPETREQKLIQILHWCVQLSQCQLGLAGTKDGDISGDRHPIVVVLSGMAVTNRPVLAPKAV